MDWADKPSLIHPKSTICCQLRWLIPLCWHVQGKEHAGNKSGCRQQLWWWVEYDRVDGGVGWGCGNNVSRLLQTPPHFLYFCVGWFVISPGFCRVVSVTVCYNVKIQLSFRGFYRTHILQYVLTLLQRYFSLVWTVTMTYNRVAEGQEASPLLVSNGSVHSSWNNELFMVNFHSVKLLRLLLSPVKPVCKEQKGCVSLEKMRVNPEWHYSCCHTVAPEV